MYFKLPYTKQKALELIEEEAAPLPDLLKWFLRLQRSRGTGESSVCAIIDCSAFELRNRQAPYCSLRAKGAFIQDGGSSIIELTWEKPGALFLRRGSESYEDDKAIIMDFIKAKLQAKVLEMHPGLDNSGA